MQIRRRLIAGGAVINTYASRSTGNLGKLDMLTGSRIIYNEKKEVVADYVLFCNDLTIYETDRVLIGTQYYTVKMIDRTTLRGSNPHLEISLKREEAP